MQKLPYFLPTELRRFSCLTYADFRILSHSASNFLINQTRIERKNIRKELPGVMVMPGRPLEKWARLLFPLLTLLIT